MRIGIIIGSLGFGGAERVTVTLSEYWNSIGNKVTIFTTMKKPTEEYLISDGILREDCNSENKLSTIIQLRNRIKRNKQDIILIMDTPMCVVAVPAVYGLGIPFVVSERSAPSTKAIKRITKILSHFLMNFATGFVFQTNGAKLYYNKMIQNRSEVIANPIQTDILPPKYEGNRDNRVVAVGRLIPAKNYPLLFKAFKIVHNHLNEYILEVYGDGELREELATLINKLEADSYIKLMGARNTVLSDINTSALYVLSSDIEGMPNALIEALALGIPCIATDCPSGGPRELINNGINGLLVDVGNETQLANTIISVLQDEKKAQILSENAFKIREQLDIAIIGKKWLRFLADNTRKGEK